MRPQKPKSSKSDIAINLLPGAGAAASEIAFRIITLTDQFSGIRGFDLVPKTFDRFVGDQRIRKRSAGIPVPGVGDGSKDSVGFRVQIDDSGCHALTITVFDAIE